MYSVVLMMALTSGAETPAFGGRGCHGGGGCHGGYAGCYGGGHGGHGCHGGGRLFGRRHGGHGCCGYDYGCHGGYGCQGGYASYGCSGGYGCWGGSMGYGCQGGAIIHQGGGMGGPEKVGDPKKGTMILPTSATLMVNLPADAKLMIDNNPTVSTSNVRRFSSPALEIGKEYVYNLKAEIVRDGQTVTTSKDVTVRAGQETQVTLDFPLASVASR